MGTVLDSHFLAITALVTVGYQFLFFVITALLKFDKVTDFAGTSNFVIIAALTLVLKGSWQMRQVVMTLLVIIWGLRLGLFLLMRYGAYDHGNSTNVPYHFLDPLFCSITSWISLMW